MIVSDIKFTITVISTKAEPHNYIVEVERPGKKNRHFAVGPTRSVGNLVGRLCRDIENEAINDTKPD